MEKGIESTELYTSLVEDIQTLVDMIAKGRKALDIISKALSSVGNKTHRKNLLELEKRFLLQICSARETKKKIQWMLDEDFIIGTQMFLDNA